MSVLETCYSEVAVFANSNLCWVAGFNRLKVFGVASFGEIFCGARSRNLDVFWKRRL